MRLGTRISLITAVAFAAIGVIMLVTAISAGRLLLGQVDDMIRSQEDSLLQSTVQAEATLLNSGSASLLLDPVFVDAIRVGDTDIMRRSLEAAVTKSGETTRPDRIELVGPDGQVIIRAPAAATEIRLVDQAALDRLGGGARLNGLRSSDGTHAYLVDATPVEFGSQVVASLAMAIDATKLVNRFASANKSQAALVTLRGQLVYATDPLAWSVVQDGISLRQSTRRLVFDWPRIFSVTSLPVQDPTGSLAGTIIAYQDVSAPIFAIAPTLYVAAALVAALVILVALAVYWYLSLSFRPLGRAVDVIWALAKGDTSQELETTGSDEIGRIGEAVRQLRINAIAASELARQRQRTRHRRERLIRREVGALADALDPQGRAEILAVLKGGQTASAPGSDSAQSVSTSSNQQLRFIAGVLRDLVRRILEQRLTLTDMIAELEAALATKDKFLALQHQLEIARQVQLAILPRDYGDDYRASIHGQMTPASEVGGDFYDCFMIDEQVMVLVVADVSGKGIPASLFMAVTRTLIRAVARFAVDPATLITEVNDLLARENDQLLFVTACMGFLDLSTGHFRYVTAGHFGPMLLRVDGSVLELPQATGMALAVSDMITYEMREMTLARGETLFFYTDGISEAQNPDGHLFGTERLLTLLQRYGALDPRLMCEMIERDVRQFESGLAPTDDLTCLAVKYLSEPAARRPTDVILSPGELAAAD